MEFIDPRLQPGVIASPFGSRRGYAVAIGGMLAVASALGIGRFVYTPILPSMAAALGLTKGAAGMIASANFVGYLAGALLTMLPNLPGGRRACFMTALIVGAASTGFVGMADSMVTFLALRFVGGVASAFVLVIGSALVMERLAAANRSGLAAIHFAGVGFGIAVSALLVDSLQALDIGWRGLWLGSAAAAGIVIPIIACLVPADAGTAVVRPSAATGHSAGSAALAPGLRALILCHGLFGFGYVVTATFLVAAVRAAPSARSLETVVWLVVGLAAAPSTAFWMSMSARIGALRAYGLACIMEAIGVAAGGVWPTVSGALAAAVLLGGTFMGITALGFAAAREIAPDRQRQSFALITAAFGVGQIAGPVIAGVLLDRTGSFAPPSLIAAAALGVGSALAIITAQTLSHSPKPA